MNKLYLYIPVLFGFFFLIGSIIPWMVSMPDSLMVFSGFVLLVISSVLIIAIVQNCWEDVINVMKGDEKNEENKDQSNST